MIQFNIRMEQLIQDNLIKKTKNKDLEYANVEMDLFIWVNGKIITIMKKDIIYIQMVKDIKDKYIQV